MNITIPDLRFEQTFNKSLESYAAAKPATGLSDEDLDLLSQELDEKDEKLQPIGQITPGIVVYAIIKDQIIMPLLQGFLWTGILITCRPLLTLVVRLGQRCGIWVSTMLGLNRLKRKYS